MINELIKLATHLDKKGLSKEANYLDAVVKKLAAKGRSRAWDPTKVHRDAKKGREKYTGEVSTFRPHPDKPGVLLGPGGQEISMEGIEQPRERVPGSMLDYGGSSLGEELAPELAPEEAAIELEELPPEAGEGLTALEEDLPSLEDEPLTVEDRLASVESRLGKIEDDLYG